MKTFVGIVLWLLLTVALIPIYLFGFFIVPMGLVADGAYRTPSLWHFWGQVEDIPDWWYERAGTSRWAKFWWMQVRNPLQGLKRRWTQPCAAKHPNPDEVVRQPGGLSRYTLVTEHGYFWEYWYMKRIKPGKYFEFRIGWRFGDTVENFSPTWQLRIGE